MGLVHLMNCLFQIQNIMIEEYIKSFTVKNMDKDSNTLTLSGTQLYKELV